MAIQNNANIGFEKQIWDAACVLWGHIPAAEYRKVIVGLIFLRYISSAFEKRYQQLVEEGDGFEDDKDAYAEDNIFFVPEDARWSKIASAAHTPEIGTVIDDAMRAIEKENTTLKNVLPKNYASPDLDKRVLGEVVDLFTNMDMGDTEESKDLLGRTYEYCIQQFAAYEGVKGGEFYTPASIVKTIVAILKPFKNCRVYDPCCGSGGMFVQSAKFIQAHSGKRGEIAVYGQESNADTWKMAKMNMAIRGIDADFGPYQADTFFNDLHKTLKADFIMANPPFNLSNWGQDKLKDDVRWKYGTPPAGNANYAWIQHMIHHLAPNGKIGLVLAKGALSSQSSGEGEIRKNIIQADLVEGIVALPTQLFYSVIKSDGVINLFSDIKEEFSLFDPKFLEEVANMKEKNLAVELLKKLIAEQISVYRRTNVVKSEKFSEIMQRSLNAYLNGMLTNEEVIEEMLNLAKQIAAVQKEGDQLGLTADELAFYDALTKPQAIKDFYENEELIAITKELADTLRRNKTIDWQKRESARAKMRMLIKKLLKKHKYPPEGMEDAVQTVMTQCELWTDNNDMGEENVINFHRKSTSYAESNYAKPLMVAESEATYKVRK